MVHQRAVFWTTILSIATLTAFYYLPKRKYSLGEDPSSEINEVRKRAYGADYFEANKATLAYPNDKGDFYTDNKYMAGDENAMEAILKEAYARILF